MAFLLHMLCATRQRVRSFLPSALAAVVVLTFCLPRAGADDAVPAATGSAIAIPLPTIPAPTPAALPPVEPDAAKELDDLLAKLAGVNPKDKQAAAAALAEQDASMLPAIAAKLSALRKSADRDGMNRLLEAARNAARKDLKRGEEDEEEDSESGSADKTSDGGASLAAEEQQLIPNARGDWLEYVLQDPATDKQPYRDLVAILALARTCTCIDSTPAAREIINIYTYFGDLFRIDVQRQLAHMKERSLAALIEAQYHDSKMVRTWAKRRLDISGRAIPSEAVRLNDNQALADVLRAYGAAREVEAVRVIVSFANSDRLQVREAAREAIGQIGEPAQWQLRDAYENLMGEKPPRGWDWQRTARELFAVYDRARLQEVYTTMDQGLAQLADDKIEEAVASFDKVLARAPMFERRAEMVPAYLAHAKSLRDKDPEAASYALRRASTIDPSGVHANAVRSELALLEARELAGRGVIDVTLFERAVELDPSNEEARRMLAETRTDVEVREASWRRYGAAVAIGVIALMAMVFVALVPRRRKPAPEEPRAREPSPPTPDEPPPS